MSRLTHRYLEDAVSRRIAQLLLLGALVVGVAGAIGLAWCCDDAFISFRYAQNLNDGHGLVYNVGERVEGYTNFLWTVIVAGGLLIGLDPVRLTQWLGIAAFVGIALLCFRLSHRFTGERNHAALAVPLSALAVLLHEDMQIWATSGLETMFTAFLVTTGFVLLVRAEKPNDFLAAGMVNVLAAMTRPDAMLFLVMAIPYILLRGERRCGRLGLYLLPFVVIYLPYWAIKYAYYGYPFPNPYYAKSASLPYYSQGWTYVWLYFKTNCALLAIVPAWIVAGWVALRATLGRAQLDTFAKRILVLGLFCTMPFVLYVMRVGGDFMFARFLIPITAMLLLTIEAAVIRTVRSQLLQAAIVAALVLMVIFRNDPFDPPDKSIDGITNEQAHYPSELISNARRDGAKLKKYLTGLDVSAAYYGKLAMLAYYSRISKAIEAAGSLTDKESAHRPIQKRGRPGHEKRIPYPELVRRGVNFVLGGTFQSQPDPSLPGVISFDGAICHIVTYHNDMMDNFRQYPEVKFLRFPEFLDQYIAGIDTLPIDRVRRDLVFFNEYYFSHNDDQQRSVQLMSHISGSR
ncbi:MAG: hypothetical protein KOO62_08605 [candidate division Zixibacteria bacterium]|nr:hypothetical protein [candidate division Zixibacteria bacterium]